MDLRPYQAAAVEAVYRHLREKDNNPCIVLPTGTGKSVVIAKIVSDSVRQWHLDRHSFLCLLYPRFL